MREGIDLPANDHRLELRAQRHGEDADDVPPEVAVAERDVGIVSRWRRYVAHLPEMMLARICSAWARCALTAGLSWPIHSRSSGVRAFGISTLSMASSSSVWYWISFAV